MKYKLVSEELEGEFEENDNFLQPAKMFFYIKPVEVWKPPLKGALSSAVFL